MRRKILVFNGYYLPAKKYGGPTTSMVTIVEHCSDEYEFYIVAANRDFGETEVFADIRSGWNNVGKAKVLYVDPNEVKYSKTKVSTIISDILPDMVWIIGILVPASKWNVINICKKKSIPVLVSPRGEVCENAIRQKYFKKKLVSSVANIIGVYRSAHFHATSDEEVTGLKKYFKVPKDRVFLVPNISSSAVVRRRVISKNKGVLHVAYVSRIVKKKNLLFAIRVVNQLSFQVNFDIYGPVEDQEYWNECCKEIEEAPQNVVINYCGELDRESVSSTFEKYHCFLFPTLSENYGHVIVEALSASCPVILSKNTTPWDDINNCGGYICDLNDVKDFISILNLIGEMNQNEYDILQESTAQYFEEKMKKDDAVNKHKAMFEKLVCNT